MILPPITIEELVEKLAPGVEWMNVHTDQRTTITTFGHHDDYGIGRNGEIRVPAALAVHHTLNVPPGFKRGHGDDLETFLTHWRPA